MAGNNQYRAQQFIDAIPGSAGIISTIARRVGCDWHTAKKYIDKFATVKAAYDDECDANLDRAESLIITNIGFGLRDQKEHKTTVESADARWYLMMKGKQRGYVQKQEMDVTSGGEQIRVLVGGIDLANDI